MADFLTEYSEWMVANSDNLQGLLGAATEVLGRLTPHANAHGVSVAHLVNDDAVTVRALLDGVGLADIAGRYQVTPESVLEAIGMTVKFATLIGAIV